METMEMDVNTDADPAPSSDNQYLHNILEEMTKEIVHPKAISTLSFEELLQLEKDVHNRLVGISQAANGDALERSQHRLGKTLGVFGRSFFLQLHRVLPHNIWKRLDTDVTDANAIAAVGELSANLRAIQYEIDHHKENPRFTITKKTARMVQHILPPSFRTKH